MNSINDKGDKLRTTTGAHGADISSQRLDYLDRACLRFAFDCCENGVAVDLGCGLGSQSIRLAAFGLRVLMIDLMDHDERVATANALLGCDRIQSIRKDARLLNRNDLPEKIDLIYSQRFLHYLRYSEAFALLTLLKPRLHTGSQLFLSVSGLRSELGHDYAHASVPIESRFSPLARDMAIKHGILEPVCLYDLRDLERLAESLGFVTVSTSRSEFGNIKGIYRVV